MAAALQTIDLCSLETVTGGRYTKAPPQLTKQIVALVDGLKQEIKAMSQALNQTAQQSNGQMMQMLGEIMKRKNGGK